MPLLKTEDFYCNHLGMSENDKLDIENFSVKYPSGEGLVNYIKNFAFDDENRNTMRTYLIRENNSSELVGYFSLKAGLVSFNENPAEEIANFDTTPGIELANFALNYSYVKRNIIPPNLGITIFDNFILPIVRNVSNLIGVRVLYIFALPFAGLIRQYEKYNFKRLEPSHEAELHKRLKPRYDSECIFMYQIL